MITKIYDNTKKANLKEIKRTIQNIKKSFALTENEKLFYDYKDNKLLKYIEVIDYDEAGNKLVNMIVDEINEK